MFLKTALAIVDAKLYVTVNVMFKLNSVHVFQKRNWFKIPLAFMFTAFSCHDCMLDYFILLMLHVYFLVYLVISVLEHTYWL